MQYRDLTKEDFKRIPNFLPEELATKPFKEILEEEESIFLEFSSSLFGSRKKSGEQRKFSQKIAETVAAFLNTDGGMLVLGVNSEKKMIGLENDLQRISKKGWIDLEQEFSNFIENMIGSQFKVYWSLEKIEHNEKIFAIVKVKKSLEPAYIKNNKTSLYTRYFGKNRKLTSKNKTGYVNIVFR